MHVGELLVLSVALATDAAVVTMALVAGARDPKSARRVWLAALITFAALQGLMPAIGYGLGTALVGAVNGYAPLLAGVVLSVVGAKTLRDAWRDAALTSAQLSPADESAAVACSYGPSTNQDVKPEPVGDQADGPVAVPWVEVGSLGIATSIDALIVGVTFPAMGVPIVGTVTTIAVVTSIVCGASGALAYRLGAAGGSWPAVLGGSLVLLLGVEMLVRFALGGG